MKTGTTSAKRFCLLGAFLIITACYPFVSIAQNSPVPAAYQLNTEQDFKTTEPAVMDCISWLAKTPRSKQLKTERKKTEDFLINWISECPYINVIIEPYVMKLASKNADLVVSFIFGYARFILQNPINKDLITANVAGLNYLLNDYRANLPALVKDPDIDELGALQKTNGLYTWVEPRLKQKVVK